MTDHGIRKPVENGVFGAATSQIAYDKFRRNMASVANQLPLGLEHHLHQGFQNVLVSTLKPMKGGDHLEVLAVAGCNALANVLAQFCSQLNGGLPIPSPENAGRLRAMSDHFNERLNHVFRQRLQAEMKAQGEQSLEAAIAKHKDDTKKGRA